MTAIVGFSILKVSGRKRKLKSSYMLNAMLIAASFLKL
jgi:hypothetical protein